MAVVYIPDELMARILAVGKDKQLFVKEAIEQKLEQKLKETKGD